MKLDWQLFVLYVLTKKPYVRYGTPLLLLVVIVYGWSYFVYVPLTEAIMMNQQLYAGSVQASQVAQKKISQLAKSQHLNERLQREIDMYLNGLQKNMQDDLLLFINDIKSHKLQLVSWKADDAKSKDWYRKHPIQCTLKGSFKDLSSLLDVMEKKYATTCKKLSLIKQAEGLYAECSFDFIARVTDEKT
jgi:hypothetical protein